MVGTLRDDTEAGTNAVGSAEALTVRVSVLIVEQTVERERRIDEMRRILEGSTTLCRGHNQVQFSTGLQDAPAFIEANYRVEKVLQGIMGDDLFDAVIRPRPWSKIQIDNDIGGLDSIHVDERRRKMRIAATEVQFHGYSFRSVPQILLNIFRFSW